MYQSIGHWCLTAMWVKYNKSDSISFSGGKWVFRANINSFFQWWLWRKGVSTVVVVNYKLTLTKSIANDWTTKAFAICLYGDWTPCCHGCWPSTTPEGLQGGVRHSVL